MKPEPPPPLPFTITITDVAQLRIQDAVRSALSALVRRSLSSAITNISTRFADISGSGLTLAGHAMPLNATPRRKAGLRRSVPVANKP